MMKKHSILFLVPICILLLLNSCATHIPLKYEGKRSLVEKILHLYAEQNNILPTQDELDRWVERKIQKAKEDGIYNEQIRKQIIYSSYLGLERDKVDKYLFDRYGGEVIHSTINGILPVGAYEKVFAMEAIKPLLEGYTVEEIIKGCRLFSLTIKPQKAKEYFESIAKYYE